MLLYKKLLLLTFGTTLLCTFPDMRKGLKSKLKLSYSS